ncbi:flagellar motor switch protein FliN [Parendozoicomonas haliclonae]|uniref:Flagellar motor switch protein FliN n=1 Tax=Parendozoicomonas haliclonae TaxID=1960125 RepID=A0A1X7ANC3_9GAMM|nr:flagellar motor switch protein FliN [Parendozoicomonas haliclonae]SMA49622.1 Flagellar motor switch protein FliN [Parendozoicomonas haliclonae]
MIEDKAAELIVDDASETIVTVDNAELTDAQSPVTAQPDLGLILDIPVVMSLEVGSTEITVSELLTMGSGAVIELNRNTGDPLDVKVNGKLVGRGEVVETNGRYGIRLTEVVSQQERLGRIA